LPGNAAVAGQPSIVHTTVPGQEAARYIVLIPREVPNSIISGLRIQQPNLTTTLPYFTGTGEYLAISDTLLKFVFNDPDPGTKILNRYSSLVRDHFLSDLFNFKYNDRIDFIPEDP
jgi:hypothetical protein